MHVTLSSVPIQASASHALHPLVTTPEGRSVKQRTTLSRAHPYVVHADHARVCISGSRGPGNGHQNKLASYPHKCEKAHDDWARHTPVAAFAFLLLSVT